MGPYLLGALRPGCRRNECRLHAGAAVSGNTPHVVVVQAYPGYDANPGHAGTGTVAGVLC